MDTRLIFTVILMLAMLFGCADNDRSNELPTGKQEMVKDTLKVDSTVLQCDSVFIATYSGTACCVSGPIVAKPGDIFRYHYQMNHADAHVSWQVLEGDISIIAGQDTHTVTVQFGANFTTGLVFADGNGISQRTLNRLRCTDRVFVTSN